MVSTRSIATSPSPAPPAASEIAIRVSHLSKSYRIWNEPAARLKAPLCETLSRLLPPGFAGRERLMARSRGYYRDFHALQDCSFEVARGETFGIVGHNGAGKSTLLQLIAGTLTPTSGDVEVRGRIAALLELGSGFDPNFTGVENVFLNGSILGLSDREIRDRFDQIAEFADIGDFIHQPVRTYSSGMVMRLAFAISVCVEPQVLIVDEALAVGDNYFVNKCFHRLNELKARGVTILFVSHSAATVTSLCSRALLLDKGSPLMLGEAEEVVNRYNQLIREKQSADVQRLSHAPAAPAAGTAKPPVAHGAGKIEFSADPELEKRCKTTRFGNGAARVVRVRLEDTAGQDRTEFVHGQSVLLKFFCEFHEDVEDLVVGYFCRTDTGINLTGTNTRIEGIRLPRQAAGSRAVMVFHTTLPVRPGIYSISVSLTGRRAADAEKSTIDWADLALSFSVHLAPNQPAFEQQLLIPHDFELLPAE
ncbi:MAG TPA: ABC transporter ATP-binding protein [Opitutaceae bacterium]|nr:ABC transporter ATP-binding protein [Opitutaceae bacterium]